MRNYIITTLLIITSMVVSIGCSHDHSSPVHTSDEVAGEVSAIGLGGDSTDGVIPLDSSIAISFSQPVVLSSITRSTAYLTRGGAVSASSILKPATIAGNSFDSAACAANLAVDANVAVESGKIVFTPAAALSCGTTYNLCLTSALRFQDGFSYAGSTHSFTTASCAPLLPTVAITALSRSGTNASAPATFSVEYTSTDNLIVNLLPENVVATYTGDATCVVSVNNGSTVSPSVSLSDCSGNGTAQISIAAGTATDSFSQTNLASAASDTLVIDNVLPTAVLGTASGAGPLNAGAAAITIPVTYNDTIVGGLTDSMLTVTTLSGNATCSKAVIEGSSQTPSVSFSNCTGNGTVSIKINANSVADAGGNLNAAASVSSVFTIDNDQPTVTTATPATGDIVNSPVEVVVTMNESITTSSVDAGDFTVGGTCSSPSVSITSVVGAVITLDLSGTCSVTQNLTISFAPSSFTDLAGNVGTGATVSRTYTRNSVWAQQAYIKQSNARAEDEYGQRLSISNDIIVAGQPLDSSNQNTITNGTTSSSNTSATNSGAAFVYERTGSNWAQTAYIKAPNSQASDSFGGAVSVSGTTIVVGATTESNSQTTITNGSTINETSQSNYSGAAYVFVKNGSNWQMQAYLKTSNADANDGFGYAVSIFGDTIAASTLNEQSNQTTITNGPTASSNNTSPGRGAVYVFTRTGNNWAQTAYIKAPNNVANLQFGHVIDMSGDTMIVATQIEGSNSTTIINGPTASSDTSAPNAGAVYVFKKVDGDWTGDAYIKAANAYSGEYFGWAASISGDTIAVSTPNERSGTSTIINGNTAPTDSGANGSGAVYVYRETNGDWAQEAFIKPVNNRVSSQFGYGVSVSGNLIVVGRNYDPSNATGVTNGSTASNDTSMNGAGAAYIYARTGTEWVQQAYLKSAATHVQDCLGVEVAISGTTTAVGAAYESSDSTSVENGTSQTDNQNRSASGAIVVFYKASGDNVVPTLGSTITFSNVATTSLTVNWGVSSDNFTIQPELEYKVVKATTTAAIDTVGEADAISGADLVKNWTPGVNSAAVTGLTSATTYAFTVLVRDHDKNMSIYTVQSQATN